MQAAVFVPVALVHPIDTDEGFYAYAAERLTAGELPYRDFFFPQMPLTTYVYGAWVAVFGSSWYAVRLLSVLFAVGTGLLLYRYCSRRAGAVPAVIAVAAYALSIDTIDWFVVVKTYALSCFLLFAALVIIDEVPRQRLAWMAAGALLTLAVDTRLYLIVPALAFVLPLVHSRAVERGHRGVVASAASGIALGAIPAALAFATAPRAFVWDTVRYHALRSQHGFVGDLHQKLAVGQSLLALPTRAGSANPQYLLLVVASVALIVLVFFVCHRLPLPFLIAALTALVSFLPTPSYPQYFSITIPFLIAGIGESVALLRRRIPDPQLKRGLRAVGVVVLIAYASLGHRELNRWAHPKGPDRITAVEEVRDRIDARTRPGEQVLSSWPGYLFGSHVISVPGFENQFAPITVRDAGPGSRRYRLGSIEDVRRAIDTGRTRLVVWRNWVQRMRNPSWRPLLERSRYRVASTVAGARLYELE
jgi:4-amino-4-deoxy-L-arabinose transferase-like glycosyltransferase